MKDPVIKNIVASYVVDEKLPHCSAIANRLLVQNKEDPWAVIIPYMIGTLHFYESQYDLGASLNLMPLLLFQKMDQGAP